VTPLMVFLRFPHAFQLPLGFQILLVFRKVLLVFLKTPQACPTTIPLAALMPLLVFQRSLQRSRTALWRVSQWFLNARLHSVLQVLQRVALGAHAGVVSGGRELAFWELLLPPQVSPSLQGALPSKRASSSVRVALSGAQAQISPRPSDRAIQADRCASSGARAA